MLLTLNLVSSICWEIITKQVVRLNVESLPLLKLLLDAVYDFSPNLLSGNLKIYWRYTQKDYLEIVDYFTFCSFLNLTSTPELYLIINDARTFYSYTEMLLKMLDLIELKRIKEANRNKYDLISEADAVEEEIQQCLSSLEDSSSTFTLESQLKDDKEIIEFALRNMPVGRCYTSDICSGYNLIDCVRKAMKGRIINCSPHQDIYFLEAHSKNEESNLENLFVSPAGREMLKYKPNTKLKQKINPNFEFLSTIQNPNRQSSTLSSNDRNNTKTDNNNKCEDSLPSSSSASSSSSNNNNNNSSLLMNPSTSSSTSDSEKSNSLDLYEEAAAILGLTCSQTDDCRCIECQCHYFDFEEEIDFPTTGNDYGQLLNVDHTSSCSIQ